MTRGELLRKLFASHGEEENFHTIAEQIIREEEQKKNHVLAQSLRKALNGHRHPTPNDKRSLRPLAGPTDPAHEFVELVEPSAARKEIVLSDLNRQLLEQIEKEFRASPRIEKRGLSTRSKLLFAGPPGCGKTMCAESVAATLGLPLYVLKIDALISSYLGETATNLRRLFDFASKRPCVLFLDEFDALARSRSDTTEHSELRRVVNSLLLYIDRLKPRGLLIAATNMEASIDPALWRRFDEVVWFEKPDRESIIEFLSIKLKNLRVARIPSTLADRLLGYSFADIERVCDNAARTSILAQHKTIHAEHFNAALDNEERRNSGRSHYS